MNKNQGQNVLYLARLAEAIDYDAFIGRNYPDRTDLENIELTQMNLTEFIYLSKRVTSVPLKSGRY